MYLFQTVAAILALLLAIKYLKMDKENGLMEIGRKKPHEERVLSPNHKAKFVVGGSDQIEGSDQISTSEAFPLYLGLEYSTQKNIASGNVGRPQCESKDLVMVASKGNISEGSEQKDNNTIYNPQLTLDRERISSEKQSQSSGVICESSRVISENQLKISWIDKSPKRMGCKQRSLVDCKSLLKETVRACNT